MANDLSTLSELEPAANDAVSAGDDEIRKTRLHVKTWADVEHHDTGQHKFPFGAGAPSGGHSGRIYMNTTGMNVMLRDDGTVFRKIANNGNSAHEYTAGALALTTAFQTLETKTLDLPLDATLHAFANCQVTPSANAIATLTFRVQLNGITIDPGEVTFAFAEGLAALTHFFSCAFANAAPGSGSKTVTFQAKTTDASPTINVSNRFLNVILC